MKTIVAESMFFPNYEDYNRYGCVSCVLEHIPDMWEAERRTDAILKAERMAALLQPKPRQPRQLHRADGRVTHVLARLASESGWRVKNPHAIEDFGVSVIYAIDPEGSEYIMEEKKPYGRLNINSRQLESMMGDMMPTNIVTKRHTKNAPVMTRADLQAYVAAQLAGENGWKEVNVQLYGRSKSQFYRIR